MAEPLLLEVKDLNIEFHDHLIPETVVYDFDLELKAGGLSVWWENPAPASP